MREKATRRVSPFLAWGDFHTRSTIPEEKWGTTRSLTTFAFFESSVLEMLFSLQRRFLAEETILHQLPP